MANYPIAGVGYAKGFDNEGNQILKSITLTDSGFNAETSLEEIRGGEGNSLQAMYAHTSKFGVSLKDCTVDLNYVAMQVGGNIVGGGDAFVTEEVTIETPNKITVSQTPKEFGGYGLVGWYEVVGQEGTTTIKFDDGKSATANGLEAGTVVCVTYVITDDSARAFEVASTFMPKVIHLVFTLPLLNSSDVSNASQVGEWVVDVPRFMFNGSIDLSTTSAGVASGDISGTALASGASGCSGKAKYATITEVIYNKDVLANVTTIVAKDMELGTSETEQIKVIGIYNDGTANSTLPNSLFTFTKGTGTSATVSSTGLVTADSSATGETVIEVVPTDSKYEKLFAKVVVDVE